MAEARRDRPAPAVERKLPKKPFRDSFVHDAQRGAQEARWGNPRDAVAQAYPGMLHTPCVALQEALGFTCAESALILALELCHPRQAEMNPKPFREHMHAVQVGNINVQQMRRACERSAIATFPIYIAHVDFAFEGAIPECTFVPFRGTKHRLDNWCIIFLPAIPDWVPEAHFTFGRIEAPLEVDDPDSMCIVYTGAAITPKPLQFWRCDLSKENMPFFLAAKAAGRACACDVRHECMHELAFMAAHPAAIKLSFLGNNYIQGTYRCQLEKNTRVERCPNNAVRVHTDTTSVLVPAGYGCAAILDIGQFFSPFSMLSASLCPRPLEPFAKKWWEPAALEVPTEMIHANFGGLPVTAFMHEPRFGVFNAIQIGSSCTLGLTGLVLCYLECLKTRVPLPSADTFKPTYYGKTPMAQWFHYFNNLYSSMSLSLYKTLSGFRLSLPANLPTVKLPLPSETRAQSFYSRAYMLATESSPRVCRRALAFVCKYRRPVVLSVCMFISAKLVHAGVRALLIRARKTRCIPIVSAPSDPRYGDIADLHLTVPDAVELKTRLALIQNVTKDHAYDLFRRLCASKGMDSSEVNATREELLTFCERAVTEVGYTRLTYDRPGFCLNCKVKPTGYRGLCKSCWRRLRADPRAELLIRDDLVIYIGVLPIFSSNFVFPATQLKKGAMVKCGKTILFDSWSTPQEMLDWYAKQHVPIGYRGRNCGPVFLGQQPTCFPRGHETAVGGFLVRLGSVAPATAVQEWYDNLWHYFKAERTEFIEPETRDEFIQHFTGQKLEKMLGAEATIKAGNYASYTTTEEIAAPVCHMTGFTKPEKSYWFSYSNDYLLPKTQVKPRFICCPSPEFLFTIGPYTHAQTKWLSRTYTSTDHLFYAGCSTPEDLNKWLNHVHHRLGGSYISIADDISSCDSSHSKESMAFHTLARAKLFGRLDVEIDAHFRAEHTLRIRVGRYVFTVRYVNGSGVSDTSFKNSLLCLFIRLFALAHAVKDMSKMRESEIDHHLTYIRSVVYTAASGDDGLTRCHRTISGTDMLSVVAMKRYEEMWGFFGFTVKIMTYNEPEWRMATFLASRPTWTGTEYEFTPEPARRLRSLFWQLDNSMHPTVWGRSVATGLLSAGAPNPVLGPIADWYLNSTTGPVVDTAIFDNPYNPFCGYRTAGRVVTQRAIEEFLIDYGVSSRDYEIFLAMLRGTPSVYVSMTCRLLLQIFRHES